MGVKRMNDQYLERQASQIPAIELFQSMGYIYISPEDCEKQRGSKYHVLLKDILRGQLRDLNRYEKERLRLIQEKIEEIEKHQMTMRRY